MNETGNIDPRQPLLQCKKKTYKITPETAAGLTTPRTIWAIWEHWQHLDGETGETRLKNHETLDAAALHVIRLYRDLGFSHNEAETRTNPIIWSAIEMFDQMRDD